MPTAFLDIDTQIDFLFPAGALYVPGAERIVDRLAALNSYAVAHSIPLVSTVCAHEENDPEFRRFRPHCVIGTVGQQKPSALLVGQRIFEKRTTDLFAAPGAEQLIAELNADHFVVYGVVTEICVKAAALGLLQRDKCVTLVSDAIAGLDPAAAQAFLRDVTGRGVSPITTRELIGS